MKGMLLNALLGLMLGRFGSVWRLLVFIPIVMAEVAYGFCVFHLSVGACVRRGTALLICGQLAFLLGALLRPMADER
jgi:predicted membrane protein